METLSRQLPRRAMPGPTPSYHSKCAGRGSECLDSDVLVAIFSRLSVQELATASMVCRTWRDYAAHETLWENLLQRFVRPENWEYVLFAETKLRSGPSFRCLASNEQPLPFKDIYKRRASAPVCVVLDGGSGYCKYGSGNYDVPDGRFPTFLEFGNIETPLFPRLRDVFVTIFESVQADPTSQPIVISEPLCNQDNTEEATESRKQLREVTFSVLFSLGVPAVCSVNQAVLAVYAARQISGVVLNIGFHACVVTPVLRGKVVREIGLETIGQGSMRLTGHLGEAMQQRGISFSSMYTVLELKEKLCYVAQDYEQEALKCTPATYTVAGDGEFTLGEERYKSPEIFFRPHLGGLQAMGIHQAVASCMQHCADYVVDPSDEGWYKTVVLAGGSACIPGMLERLEKELLLCLDNKMSVGLNVFKPVVGDAVWFGAKTLSNLSSFQEEWCVTKKQFAQSGHSVAHALANEIM